MAGHATDQRTLSTPCVFHGRAQSVHRRAHHHRRTRMRMSPPRPWILMGPRRARRRAPSVRLSAPSSPLPSAPAGDFTGVTVARAKVRLGPSPSPRSPTAGRSSERRGRRPKPLTRIPSAPAGDFKGVTAGCAKATVTFKRISKRAFLPHQLMWGLCPAPF